MKISSFTKVMSLGSAIFGGLFLFTLLFSNPEKGLFVRVTFFVSLFAFVFCFLSIILFYTKKRTANNEVVYLFLKSSVRQGFLIGLFLVLALLLASLKLLTWWDSLLLASSLVLIELYFKSGKITHAK